MTRDRNPTQDKHGEREIQPRPQQRHLRRFSASTEKAGREQAQNWPGSAASSAALGNSLTPEA